MWQTIGGERDHRWEDIGSGRGGGRGRAGRARGRGCEPGCRALAECARYTVAGGADWGGDNGGTGWADGADREAGHVGVMAGVVQLDG